MAGGWALSSQLCLEFPHCSVASQQASPKFCHLGSLLTVGAYADLLSAKAWSAASREKVVCLNGVKHPGLCTDHSDSVLAR